MPDTNLRLSRELFLRSFLGGPAAASPWMIDRLSGVLEEGEVKAGETIFREGDLADRMYFVGAGRVRISREGHPSYLYAGRWILGGIDVLNERMRRNTATVLNDVVVQSVKSEDWFDILEETLEVARDIVSMQMAGTARFYSRLAPKPFLTPPPSPPVPTRRLSLFDRLLTFFDGPMLRKAGVQTLAILAEACEEIRLETGASLIAADTPRDHIYIVAYGAIETTYTNPAMQGCFGRSSVVGSVGAITTGWSARAAEPSVVLALPIEDWLDAMTHFDLFRCTMAWAGLERERIIETLAESTSTELVFE